MNNNNDRRLKIAIAELRDEIVGIDTLVPLLDGTRRPYVFLDNGASTPTFKGVLKRIGEFLPWYSSVHRGSGFKSLIATEASDRAHDIAGTFVGADLSSNHVIFTKNTTECVNKVANRFPFKAGDVVITTAMEHHSNLLPWRRYAKVVHVGLTEFGELDLASLRQLINQYTGQVKLVAVTGASNITGVCSPIHQIAEWAHAVGAKIFVDAAQLVPHRAVNILPNNHPQHIDFLAFSAHKMYAPFGIGVLVGPISFFAQGEPDTVGGGVVDIVTLDDVVWNETRHKEEAGSPNVVGAIALAEAMSILSRTGMDEIAAHEKHLLEYAFRKLKKTPRLTFYGPTEDLENKVGVIAFTVEGMHHALVAAILGAEWGIGVRNGYFCAQPYVKRLLHVSPEEEATGCGISGDKSHVPGMVRASFGCYTNEQDIDRFVEAMDRIVRGEYAGTYLQDERTGAFHAEGMSHSLKEYFSFLDDEELVERPYSEAS